MELQMIPGLSLCGRSLVVVPKAERRTVQILSAQRAIDTFLMTEAGRRSEG
jgi:hypothetical protein